MPATLPYTLTNGTTADATQTMANLDAIRTYSPTPSDLANPNALFAISGTYNGTLATAGTNTGYVLDFKVPSGQTWTLTEVQFSFRNIVANTPTVTMHVEKDGVTVFSSTFSTASEDTIATRTSFATGMSTLAAGERVKAWVVVSGSSAQAEDFFVTLLLKTQHRT